MKIDPFSQGTGLGLPICRLIAAKLGGRLFVDPKYASGCRMIFEVPFDLPETSARNVCPKRLPDTDSVTPKRRFLAPLPS